jgi:hypothetical protein
VERVPSLSPRGLVQLAKVDIIVDPPNPFANPLVAEIQSPYLIALHDYELDSAELVPVLIRIPRQSGRLRRGVLTVHPVRVEQIHRPRAEFTFEVPSPEQKTRFTCLS